MARSLLRDFLTGQGARRKPTRRAPLAVLSALCACTIGAPVAAASIAAPTPSTRERVGLLLVNLGTPDAPRPREVRRYLREFLSDPRVLDVSALRRLLLLELVILPRRTRASAAAYRKIWTAEGSPLLVHGRALAAKLQARLGDGVRVELAMRYGQPSIESALDRLEAAGASRIVLFPLYAHYSAAATGSSIERVYRLAGARWNTPYVHVVPPFYDHPAYLDARAASVRPFLAERTPERVFMSFHGLPERHLRRGDRGGDGGPRCLARADCCAEIHAVNRDCYRAQCFAAAHALARRLAIDEGRVIVCFQSRLGRTPWLRPYTDEALAAEARRGARDALVVPSFVADCLETLEELALRGVETWRAHGGESLRIVPALNADDRFVEAVITIATERSGFLAAARPDR
jgi:ferrochelatase